ncbi:hypothetical protein COT72_00145 [archaeon CG10_big_fil_rev_8_21_14_0_10_43_11]|nr:MAG: hypothetical protein COT72_00145 [archaeon CG10_big_fil_rev_8_21_14_0_10_43_11]
MNTIIPDDSFVKSIHGHKKKKGEQLFTPLVLVMLGVSALLIGFNVLQLQSVTGMATASVGGAYSAELSSLDINTLKSTGHTVAAVFPIQEFKTQEDVMRYMFPTGTPSYGAALSVSFDDPITSLSTLARMYEGLKSEVKTNNPDGWQRFISLATKPVGISCEYCCGVGPIGVDSQGNSRCGCQHNPAMLSLALYLSAYTDMPDGQILQEAMKWKTLFFPKNMIELGLSLAGGDTSGLQENLPGMVGGC